MLAGGCAHRLVARQQGHSAAVAVEYESWRHCRPGRCCIVAVCAGVGKRETAVDLVLVGSGWLWLAACHGSIEVHGRHETSSGKAQDGLREGATFETTCASYCIEKESKT
jgi:hypothetical protein